MGDHFIIFREKLQAYKYLPIKSKKINCNFIFLNWDSRFLPDILEHKHMDRLPVIVNNLKLEQLLGVPAIRNESIFNYL